MPEFKYRAFISYSHADEKWGRWLHRALETFRIPKEIIGQETTAGIIPGRLGKVFRDDDELGASADLSEKITAALEQSDVLIVVCSPNAAQSQWVNKEIADFKTLGRAHRVFAMIVDGEPNAADPAQECFPDSLKYEIDQHGQLTDELAEPLATDVRKFGKQDSLLRLVSGLLDVDYDILKDRERIRVRRQARRAQILFASGLSLSIVAVISLWFSVINQYNGLTNRSVSFAQISTRYSEIGKYDRAMLWALGGIPSQSQLIKEDYSQARAQLIRSYRNNTVLSGQSQLRYADLSPDARQAVTVYEDGSAWIWDTENGAVQVTLEGHTDAIRFAAFSPDGKLVVTASRDTTARLWESATGQQVAVLSGHQAALRHAIFSPDGKRVVTSGEDNLAVLWALPANLTDDIPGMELAGHTDRVRRAQFSPDGTRIITASYDKSAIVWDAGTGEKLAALEGHAGAVFNAHFNPDGTQIVTASADSTARIWDVETGAQLSELRGEQYFQVYHAAYSPDGTRIVTGATDGSVRIWNARSGSQLKVYEDHQVFDTTTTPGDSRKVARGGSEVYYVTFSPDGNYILSASRDTTARIWDARTHQNILELTDHERLVLHAAFSHDGRQIITVSGDDTARIWDWQSGRELTSINDEPILSPDRTRMITTKESVDLRDGNSGKIRTRLQDSDSHITATALNSSGERIAMAIDEYGIGWSVGIWDGETGEKLFQLPQSEAIDNVAISHDGKRVLITTTDGTASLWNTDTREMVRELDFTMPGRHTNTITFSKDDNRLLLTSRYDNPGIFDNNGQPVQAALLDGKTGSQIREFTTQQVQFSPDGKFALFTDAGAENALTKVDSETGEQIYSVPGKAGTVTKLAFTESGKKFLTGNINGTAHIWDFETGTEQLKLDHPGPVHQAAISPDGTRIVTASANQTAVLWNGETGQEILTMTGVLPVFSPDGTRFALSSSDNIARLRDSTTGQELAEMRIHLGMITNMYFTPDGTNLVTQSTEGTTRYWDAMAEPAAWKLSDILEHSCTRIQKNGFSEYMDTLPVLAGVSPDGGQLKNPCEKRGLLGLDWWKAQYDRYLGN